MDMLDEEPFRDLGLPKTLSQCYALQSVAVGH